MTEHRYALGEVRAAKPQGIFEARACVYNVPDDFGTVWRPGCWAESLRQKLPKIVWGHDWLTMIGSVVDYRDTDEALYVTGQLANFDEVPKAREAYSLMRDGHCTDISFGFDRQQWRAFDGMDGAKEEMLKAGMDEISPVLVGAVGGAKVLAVRDAKQARSHPLLDERSGEVVEADTAARVIARLGVGEIDLYTALGELQAAATRTTGQLLSRAAETLARVGGVDDVLLSAELDEALAIAERALRR